MTGQLALGDRVRIVDAKRREDLRYDGRTGRVGRMRSDGLLVVSVEDRGQRIGILLPLEGPDAVIVERIR